MRRLFILVSMWSLVATLDAQSTYGNGSPGTGGVVPTISCGQAWMGNAGWGVSVSDTLGGAAGVVGVSPASATANYGPLPVWIDLNLALPFFPIVTTGVPGSAGGGDAFLPLPLTVFPVASNLAGQTWYWQAAIVDFGAPNGSNYAVTSGLAAELTMPPLVFVGSGTQAAADPRTFVDPATGAALWSGSGPVGNFIGATFTDAGTHLYVRGSDGNLAHADLTGSSPAWTNLQAGLGITGINSGNANATPDDKILWTVGSSSTLAMEFVGIDVEQGSPTYGSVLHESNGLTNAVGSIPTWALSEDGKKAAIPSLLNGFLFLYDLDPNSPTFLQQIGSSLIPYDPSVSLWANAQVAFFNDDAEVLIARMAAGGGCEIARYSMAAGAFIDHDPSTQWIENMGANSTPPVSFGAEPGQMDASGDSFVVVGKSGAGWLQQVRVLPSGAWTAAGIPSLPNAVSCRYDADGTRIAVGSGVSGAPGSLRILDSATLAPIATTPLSFYNPFALAWR